MDNKENVREAWIRVVGLPLHLWRHEVLKKIGDCGGFLAIDKETALRVKVSWARILVKIGEMARPSVINILERKRNSELQIWWELSSKSIEVYPSKARKSQLQREREEEEEEEEQIPHVGRSVRYSTKASSDEGRLDNMGETVVSACRGWEAKVKRHKAYETRLPKKG